MESMRKKFLVIGIFVLLIVAITFPLVFKITTYIPGFFSTDELVSNLWDSWEIKYSLENNLTSSHASLTAYPFGQDFSSPSFHGYIWSGLIHILSKFTTPVFALNLQIILNLFLSAFFSYLLIFYLTQNRLVSFFGGLIFGFCPYQFTHVWQHLGLTYNQWIPFSLLAAILLKDKMDGKFTLLFSISLLLLLSFDFCVMYFGVVTLAMFFIYVILYQWREKLFKVKEYFIKDYYYIKKVFIVGIIVFVILSPQFFPIIRNRLVFSPITQASAFNPYHRSFDDLFNQSARPLSYFLPATVHPFFGKFTEQFIGSTLYGLSFTEHTLYLGWVPLILAFYAFRRWRKTRKNRKQASARTASAEDFYIGFFIFLAIAAWLFSQPPWWQIGIFKIYMPSFFMYKILPMYRAYCRFGIVLMLAVAVLAGFGLKFLLEKFKNQKVKFAVTILCCGLVLFEFWNWPPYKVIDVSKVPEVYYWIKNQQDDFVIAEYPLDYNGPNEMYKFYQTVHEKRIVNGSIPGTYSNKVAQTLKKLSDFKTTGVLGWMGVKYIIVHRDDYLNTEDINSINELQDISNNPNLKLIKRFSRQDCPDKDIMCVQKSGPIDVYLLEAIPVEPSVNKT